MRRFCCCLAMLLCCFLLSCARSTEKPAPGNTGSVTDTPARPAGPEPVPPLAVLQAGEFPLWFQLIGDKPVLIETIEDACFSAALVPWPLAPHIRAMLARGDELMTAVNGNGFICFSPWGGGGGHTENSTQGTGLYHFPGGDVWRPYTVSAFVLVQDQPAALLYRDDRFIESKSPLPSPRLWTFDRYSPLPQPLAAPALDAFIPEEHWDVDSLRRGADDHWYFRAVRKSTEDPEIRMLRGESLDLEGERISLGAFQNSALPQPLSAAPPSLAAMLTAALAESGAGYAAVTSPEFDSTRTYTADRENTAPLVCFYSRGPDSSGAFLLTTLPSGSGIYLETSGDSIPSVSRFSLPPLPEHFVYTGIGLTGDTVIASWEEQHEYSIGAAGFMAIKLAIISNP